MTAYDVTFRIVPPNAPDRGERVLYLVGVLRQAFGFATDDQGWTGIEPPLRAGVEVRVRISAEQFCRFFLARRAAGVDAVRRLKWSDPEEITA